MSSDSEEDFLSADEGSDSDLPSVTEAPKSHISALAEKQPPVAPISSPSSIATQANTGTCHDSQACTPDSDDRTSVPPTQVPVKVSFLEELFEPPPPDISSLNVLEKKPLEIKDLTVAVDTRPETDSSVCDEGPSDCEVIDDQPQLSCSKERNVASTATGEKSASEKDVDDAVVSQIKEFEEITAISRSFHNNPASTPPNIPAEGLPMIESTADPDADVPSNSPDCSSNQAATQIDTSLPASDSLQTKYPHDCEKETEDESHVDLKMGDEPTTLDDLSSEIKQIPSTSSFQNTGQEPIQELEEVKKEPNAAFLAKPRKTSKIGLKKPREKLGERLGAKRLGTKVGKPLDSISCDAFTQQDKQTEAIHNSPLKTEDSWEKIDANELAGDMDSRSSKATEEEEDVGWGGSWGGWGSSLLSAASTLSQEVGRGVGSVVELVEDGMGVPSPEQLAREQLEREQQLKAEAGPPAAEAAEDGSSIGSSGTSSSAFAGLGLGGLTSLVSTAGSKVMFGGLDTLEMIGRRTMDVLQETDPGLRTRKQKIMERVNKPNLSAVLREARELAVANPDPDSAESIAEDGGRSSARISFMSLWDNSTGPAHLEALALIARQCSGSTKDILASLPATARRQLEDEHAEIMALSEIEEENLSESSIFAEKVASTIRELHLPLNADNIAQCWSDLSTLSTEYGEGSSGLQEATSSPEASAVVERKLLGGCVLLVERLVTVAHKAAEMCLTTTNHTLQPVQLAASFRELVVLGSSQLEGCADAVCTGLSSTAQQEELAPLITNIYMQVCEGSSCLQQSLVHLCTTLQLVQAQSAVEELA